MAVFSNMTFRLTLMAAKAGNFTMKANGLCLSAARCWGASTTNGGARVCQWSMMAVHRSLLPRPRVRVSFVPSTIYGASTAWTNAKQLCACITRASVTAAAAAASLASSAHLRPSPPRRLQVCVRRLLLLLVVVVVVVWRQASRASVSTSRSDVFHKVFPNRQFK